LVPGPFFVRITILYCVLMTVPWETFSRSVSGGTSNTITFGSKEQDRVRLVSKYSFLQDESVCTQLPQSQTCPNDT